MPKITRLCVYVRAYVRARLCFLVLKHRQHSVGCTLSNSILADKSVIYNKYTPLYQVHTIMNETLKVINGK